MLGGGDVPPARARRAVHRHRLLCTYFYLWEKQKHVAVLSSQRIVVGAAQRGLTVGPFPWLNWALAQSQGQQKTGQLPKAVSPSVLARPDRWAAVCARVVLAGFPAVHVSLRAGESACRQARLLPRAPLHPGAAQAARRARLPEPARVRGVPGKQDVVRM